MTQKSQQWLVQANYDFDTAEFMFKGGRYFYTVFMCHLAIEKAFKGIYQQKFNEPPPRTHNLGYLINKLELKPPTKIGKFLIKINQASVRTRYPEDLDQLQKYYTLDTVRLLLDQTRETIEWIKKLY